MCESRVGHRDFLLGDFQTKVGLAHPCYVMMFGCILSDRSTTLANPSHTAQDSQSATELDVM